MFLSFYNSLSLLFAGSKLKCKDLTILCFSAQTQYQGKFCFIKLYIKLSYPIRLEQSSIANISGRKASISSIFWMIPHEGKITSENATIGWVCPGMRSHSHTCLDLLWAPWLVLGDSASSNFELLPKMCYDPIRLLDCLVIDISWSVSVLGLVYKDSQQGKIASKTSIVGWMWLCMPSHATACLNLSKGDFSWAGGGMATLR